jgi:hypothetical protein
VLILVDRNGAHALLLYSSLGILDTGIVPMLYPTNWSIRLGLRLMTLCSGHFQHSHSEDSKEKPCSETLAAHLGSEYGTCKLRLEGNHDTWVKLCHLYRV